MQAGRPVRVAAPAPRSDGQCRGGAGGAPGPEGCEGAGSSVPLGHRAGPGAGEAGGRAAGGKACGHAFPFAGRQGGRGFRAAGVRRGLRGQPRGREVGRGSHPGARPLPEGELQGGRVHRLPGRLQGAAPVGGRQGGAQDGGEGARARSEPARGPPGARGCLPARSRRGAARQGLGFQERGELQEGRPGCQAGHGEVRRARGFTGPAAGPLREHAGCPRRAGAGRDGSRRAAWRGGGPSASVQHAEEDRRQRPGGAQEHDVPSEWRAAHLKVVLIRVSSS
mmetsp:Transcript_107684/g.300038  ORF Transcript_107684/g.300038 Transcript_107684/m.300038 type:complete len:280 (+) Transcript_107684:200-1039(+)